MENEADAGSDQGDEFSTHASLISFVLDRARERNELISNDLRAAFDGYIETRSTVWVVFDKITASELARIFAEFPTVVKAVTAACNIAGRAIKQDLGFDLDTYRPNLKEDRAAILAGYVKPFLPSAMALPTLEAIDDFWFKDKEIRAEKGRWEIHTTGALTARTGLVFRKRKFLVMGEEGDEQRFELDAAYPPSGEPIEVGIDVKRIGHPRDIHKRTDEIVNKAEKFKKVYPNGRFGSVIYFPYDEQERGNLIRRLMNPSIDGIVFAGQAKQHVEQAILELIPRLGLEVVEATPPSSLYDELRGE